MPYGGFTVESGDFLGEAASPWGTLCAEWPDEPFVAEFLVENADSARYTWRAFGHDVEYQLRNTAESEFGSPYTDEFSGTLSAAERARIDAAIALIGSDLAQDVLKQMLGLDNVGGTVLVSSALYEAFVKLQNEANSLVIGKNTGTNPFYRLLYTSTVGGVTLVTGGVAKPRSFVFPLKWEEATKLVNNEDAVPYGLPDEVRTELAIIAAEIGNAEFADVGKELQTAITTWTSDDSLTEEAQAGRAAAAFFGYSLVNTGVFGLLVGAEIVKAYLTVVAAEPLQTIADFVASAGEQERINDSVADLFSAVLAVPTAVEALVQGVVEPILLASDLGSLGLSTVATNAIREAIGGLGDTLVDDLVGAGEGTLDLVAVSLRTDLQSSSYNYPVIHLHADVLDFYFADYAAGYSPTAENAWPNGTTLSTTWGTWLDNASPALQFAYVLRLSTEILVQTLNMHSLLLAISEEANADGPAGTMFRGILTGAGYPCMASVFGGVSFSRMVGMIFRQYVADRFIVAWIDRGHDPDCLYEIFCWMRTDAQQGRINRVLGTLDETTGVRDFQHGFLGSVLISFDPCGAWDDLRCDEREEVKEFVEDTCFETFLTSLSRDASDSDYGVQGQDREDRGPVPHTGESYGPYPFGEDGKELMREFAKPKRVRKELRERDKPSVLRG